MQPYLTHKGIAVYRLHKDGSGSRLLEYWLAMGPRGRGVLDLRAIARELGLPVYPNEGDDCDEWRKIIVCAAIDAGRVSKRRGFNKRPDR